MKLLVSLCAMSLVVGGVCDETYTPVANEALLPILTPALQERSVDKLVLKNGLQVYLISDPGANQSAAAVAVRVGSWDDPKEYPGTAHFLEHMLFMGTAAYPQEEEYMQYIHEHGGKVNAFTATDRTVYMFSIDNDAYDEALDRFSHFFIDPLLSTSCINRELLAVDQEHSKNIEHDGWRQWMILKESGNPNHPHSTFSTGNAETLSGIPQSALKTWYESRYSADKMTLVMLSPLPLEDMRAIALQDFSAVPKSAPLTTQLPSDVTSPRQRGHMLFIKPVKELNQLSLTWEVKTPYSEDLRRQAPALVAYALGQEGQGSLTRLLKEKKIAEDLHISCDHLSPTTLFFSIDIDLTEQGLKQVDQTIAYVFEALARLKTEGYPSYLFNEVQTLAKLDYQFQSRQNAFDAVMSMASEIPYESLSTYPEQTHIPTQYDPAFIHAFLNTLKAEDCIYCVIADPAKTKIATDVKEKWMQAEYSIRPVSKTRMTAWNEKAPSDALQLPGPNPYLPTDLTLLSSEDSPNEKSPLLLISDAGSSVYYAQDTRYKIPAISFRFSFKSPVIENTATSQALCDLYAHTLREKLSSSLTLAEQAGLSVSFKPVDLSLKLSIIGYNDKAPLLLSEIFATLPHLTLSLEEFALYKKSIATDYDNASKELPVRQAMQQIAGVLCHTPTSQEKLAAIQAISPEQFLTFAQDLFKQTYTEAFLYGNISQDGAEELWETLHAKLDSEPCPRSELPKTQVLVLNAKTGPRKIVQSTDRQGCSALLLLQEGPYTIEGSAIQGILGNALSDAFFDTLRTKQQTGYFARAWTAEKERQMLQFFAVQSSTHAPADLLARFELFLESFDKNLNIQIPEGRFEGIRSTLITQLKLPPENMVGMAERLNTCAFEYHDFSLQGKEIEGLKALSYETFCKQAHLLLSRHNPRRLAVLMEGVLPKENDFRYEAITKEDLFQTGTFSSR